jgi:hypothetical protein
MSSNSTLVSPSFVPQPSGRGTIGLLWSCTLTISLCIWTSLHLNIHRPGTGRSRAFCIKLKWAVVAILSPEFVVAVAIQQILEARHTKMEYNKHTNLPTGSEPVIGNEVAHSLRCPVPGYRKEQKKGLWTMKQGYFVSMGGIHLTKFDEIPRLVEPDGVVSLARLDMLPNLPSSLIESRSKVDGLAKTLICIQISWMFLQTIARKPNGLPITLLELHTLTHIVAAVLLYAIWWYKPQGIAEAVVLNLGGCSQCIQAIESSTIPAISWNERDMFDPSDKNGHISIPAFLILGVINGAVHATAWNAHFPSPVEHQLWRIASCGICGLSLYVLFLMVAENYLKSKSETLYSRVLVIGLCLFYIGRLFLVVEAFISVRSLPIGAYDTIAWVTFLPHIG